MKLIERLFSSILDEIKISRTSILTQAKLHQEEIDRLRASINEIHLKLNQMSERPIEKEPGNFEPIAQTRVPWMRMKRNLELNDAQIARLRKGEGHVQETQDI